MISSAAAREIRDAALSETFRNDMKTVSDSRHNPFIKNGNPDADAYLVFVSEFNVFVNHAPKRVRAHGEQRYAAVTCAGPQPAYEAFLALPVRSALFKVLSV